MYRVDKNRSEYPSQTSMATGEEIPVDWTLVLKEIIVTIEEEEDLEITPELRIPPFQNQLRSEERRGSQIENQPQYQININMQS